MNSDYQLITRTITLTTVGTRFKEGPIDVRGWDIAAVQARLTGATAWASGVVELKSSLFHPEEGGGQSTYRSFSSAQQLVTGTPAIRALGESSPAGITSAAWLDGFVTTAEASVELAVAIYLRRTG